MVSLRKQRERGTFFTIFEKTAIIKKCGAQGIKIVTKSSAQKFKSLQLGTILRNLTSFGNAVTKN